MALYTETFNGTMGHAGMAGAPTLHFNLDLTVGVGTDATVCWPVTGTASVSQAVANGNSTIQNLTGQAYSIGESLVIVLAGEFAPPSSSAGQAFNAAMIVDGKGRGAGNFNAPQPIILAPVVGTIKTQ